MKIDQNLIDALSILNHGALIHAVTNELTVYTGSARHASRPGDPDVVEKFRLTAAASERRLRVYLATGDWIPRRLEAECIP